MSHNTKIDLGDALKKVLRTKELKDVTVMDVSDACGVKRQTFYYHFDDLDELVYFTWSHELESALDENVNRSSWKEILIALISKAQGSRDFALSLYRAYSNDKISFALINLTKPLIFGIIENAVKANNFPLSEENIDDIVYFYSYSFMGLINKWFAGGMKEDPAALVEKAELIFGGTLPNYAANLKRKRGI